MDESTRKEKQIGDVGHLFLSGQKQSALSSRAGGAGVPAGEGRPAGGTSLIGIASGNDEIARSLFTVHLATELSRIGHRTSIIPQISIAPNAVTFLGLGDLEPARKNSGVELFEGPFGVSLVVVDGKQRNAPGHFKNRTLPALEEMTVSSRFLLLELPGNLNGKEARLLHLTDEIVLLATPDPDQMTATFRQLKTIVESSRDIPAWVVAYGVDEARDGELISREFDELAGRFLEKRLEYLGFVYKDLYHFITCVEEPSALNRKRFSRIRKCYFDMANVLCMMEDFAVRTLGRRPPLTKRS